MSMYVAERDVSALGRVQNVKGLARGIRGSRARYRRNDRGGDVVEQNDGLCGRVVGQYN